MQSALHLLKSFFSLSVAPRLLVGQGLLILEASRSQSVGLHWTSYQPDIITHSTHKRQASMTPDGIRTRNPSKRATEDPRGLRPRGHQVHPSEDYPVLYVASKSDIFINTGLNV